MLNRLLLVPVLVSIALAVGAQAADWPQWRGPERTGISKETGLLQEWPRGGPQLLWKNPDVGDGYSTPAVADGHIYLMSHRGDTEFAVALDARNGKQVWATPVGKVGKNTGPQYPGARSTPTVDGELLFGLGSDGDLACLERKSGKLLWKKNYQSDFGGAMGMWAYAESPLVDGEVVVGTPGGPKATLVALNKRTGEPVWQATIPGGDKAGYASIVASEAGGVRQYVQFLHNGVVGVEATTGKFLWRDSRTADKQANIPTPVVYDDYVFSTASRIGSGLVKLAAGKEGVTATPVYLVKEPLNGIGGVVLLDGHLYGTNGRRLVCMEFASGKVKWQNGCVGSGAVSAADGRLYVRGETGDVALVEATPAEYRERGRFSQPDRSNQAAWPHPVVANGCLYLRDMGVLLCYDVKA